MVIERISVEGHLLDDNTLAHVMAKIDEHGVEFTVRRFKIGRSADDESVIELELRAQTPQLLHAVLNELKSFGAEFSVADAELAEADMDGVLPEGFYSTTNFPTYVRVDGQEIPVEKLEMDVGIRITRGAQGIRAETCPMHRVRKGDTFVVGFGGIKVVPGHQEDVEEEEFRFMINDVSTERPKGRLVGVCAQAIRHAKERGQKVLLVGGPAIIHCGCAHVLAKLIEDRWVDVLFAGNALAAHDIEAAMMGTSLGVDLSIGHSVPHGHTHHLRCINRVRRAGSIRAAVESGMIPSGVMYTCVKTGTPFVLCGSIRDDGPLPDVYTDNVEGQDAMREQVPGVGVAILCATTLHSVATGNMLPASVATFCVDSDADTVIKLTDRGTHQAVGIVTDVEFFLKELARQLES